MVKVIKWHPATIRNRTNIKTTKKGKKKKIKIHNWIACLGLKGQLGAELKQQNFDIAYMFKLENDQIHNGRQIR